MGSKSSPAPDYVGAAQATAAGNVNAAQVAADANRVNQNTPYGSISWQPPSTPDGQWTSTQTLSPDQQTLLNGNNQLSQGLLGLGNSTLGQIGSNLSTPITAADLPANMVNPGESGQQAYMRMAAPDLQMARQTAESQAAQQGITQGSEAWQNMQRQLGVNENNAENQSIQTGFGMGQQAQQQALQTQTALKSEPINMISALRSGSQVTNPTFSGVPQQQATTGADILGATNAAGQWQQGINNANTSTTNAGISAAGTAAAAYAAYLY